jgi:hypothetical protein
MSGLSTTGDWVRNHQNSKTITLGSWAVFVKLAVSAPPGGCPVPLLLLKQGLITLQSRAGDTLAPRMGPHLVPLTLRSGRWFHAGIG